MVNVSLSNTKLTVNGGGMSFWWRLVKKSVKEYLKQFYLNFEHKNGLCCRSRSRRWWW
jgi:hypothetical protein